MNKLATFEQLRKCADAPKKYILSLLGDITGTVADALDEVAGYAADKVENMEIGGRNLLYKYIRAGGNTIKIDDLTIKVGTGTGDTYFYLKAHQALKAGETYTLSCDASNVPSGCDWIFGVRAQASVNQLHINKNGRCYVVCKWDVGVGADAEFMLNDYGGRPTTAPNIILSNFKLEKGNKATDWTPAPEDIDAKFASLRADIMEQIKGAATPVTIPMTGWNSDNNANYPKYYDIAVTGLTANDRAEITIAPSSMGTAISCGLCPTNETLAGKIRVRSTSIPTAAIAAEYWIEDGKE